MQLARVQPLHNKQVRRLIVAFLAWKCLLFVIAACSPGPGYDTSALILLSPGRQRHGEFTKWSRLDRLGLNLFRWDALYFVNSAQRGHMHEHEWAFSWAYSRMLQSMVQFVFGDESPSLQHYIWSGIGVSNILHFASIMALWNLLKLLLSSPYGGRLPFTACLLHIVSPAGLFLSAPYTEACFAALNFSGMASYIHARRRAASGKRCTYLEDLAVISSGLFFGIATCVRSNGLLGGLLYLFDVAAFFASMMQKRPNRDMVRRIAITCVAGTLLAVGFIAPQYLAYRKFCDVEPGHEITPWCRRTIPSIYTWVQSKYWNVGFLRYWTLPNLPLFLLAAPMLWLLLRSAVAHISDTGQQPLRGTLASPVSEVGDSKDVDATVYTFPQLALPELALAVAAVTSFHVQVINRLSSGYPIWYLSVAKWMTTRGTVPDKLRLRIDPQVMIRGMITYALIQGALFAGFLPPA